MIIAASEFTFKLVTGRQLTFEELITEISENIGIGNRKKTNRMHKFGGSTLTATKIENILETMEYNEEQSEDVSSILVTNNKHILKWVLSIGLMVLAAKYLRSVFNMFSIYGL